MPAGLVQRERRGEWGDGVVEKWSTGTGPTSNSPSLLHPNAPNSDGISLPNRLEPWIFLPARRSVAQLGRAPALGAGCRRFKSCRSDHFSLSRLGATCRDSHPIPITDSLRLPAVQFWLPCKLPLSGQDSGAVWPHTRRLDGTGVREPAAVPAPNGQEFDSSKFFVMLMISGNIYSYL